jgi:hypothetical protein
MLEVDKEMQTYKISESKSKQVEIERNGDVTWIQFGSFETKCSIDVPFYPYLCIIPL